MLTYTYAQVALLLEQRKTQTTLFAITDYFRDCLLEKQHADQCQLEHMLDRLIQFAAFRHQRHVELYVIPEIRKTTREADALLSALDALCTTSEVKLTRAKEGIRFAFLQGDSAVKELCKQIHECCNHLIERLAREESEVFPLACRVISSDGWFHIASQLISHIEEALRPRMAHTVAEIRETA